MAHVHAHEHQHGNYYLDQLLIVAFSGALGVIMILLYKFNVLKIFLNTQFHLPLLLGAVALLVLVAIRAVSLWVEMGRLRLTQAHTHEGEHDHEHCHHDHDHTHEHGDHDHDHDHVHACGHEQEHSHEDEDCGHDHGFSPWRYMVLMVPVALFLLRMPWPAEPEKENVPENVTPIKLTEAEQSAGNPQQREFWTKEMNADKRVQLKAKAEDLWHTDKRFGLVRMRMTCCYADAYGEPVKIVIETPKHPIDYDQVRSHGGWVKIIGKLDYRQLAGGEYITVVNADSWQALKKPPVNQFDN